MRHYDISKFVGNLKAGDIFHAYYLQEDGVIMIRRIDVGEEPINTEGMTACVWHKDHMSDKEPINDFRREVAERS